MSIDEKTAILPYIIIMVVLDLFIAPGLAIVCFRFIAWASGSAWTASWADISSFVAVLTAIGFIVTGVAGAISISDKKGWK